jgi:DNA-binding LacI/PurR family transcriptional regulator
MSNVRIKDVAEHAGVSEATITRVVNNKGYVAGETRKRVLKSVKALKYVPNRMASALKSRRTGIIGNILTLSMDNPFFSKIAVSLKQAALEYDYQILPMYHESDRKLEDKLIHAAMSRMAEGIIFTAEVFASPASVRELLNKQIPVIMIERPLRISGVDKVLLDDLSGSAEAARKFFAMGHRRLGFIGRELRSALVERNRFNGYKQVLQKNGAPLNEKCAVFTREYTSECGYAAMKLIIEQTGKKRPTACLITSDTLACGALQYLYDVKLRVPGDISIIGYDNTLSSLCSPPITSVAIPYEDIGKTAITLFRERREQGRTFDKTVQLGLSILDRGSVLDLRV